MVMSVTLLLVESAGVKFSELNLLGNKLLIENPNVINVGLWIAFLYWLYRYYVYFHDIGEKGFVENYRSRMMDFIFAFALKQLKRDTNRMEVLAKTGRTKLRLGSDRTFYRQSLWRYDIKLIVNASSPTSEDDNQEWIALDHYVVSAPFPLAIAHTRAWLYVLTRTHLSSEYLLPFAVALLPVVYFIWRYLACSVIG